jgi:hypothetical protein
MTEEIEPQILKKIAKMKKLHSEYKGFASEDMVLYRSSRTGKWRLLTAYEFSKVLHRGMKRKRE